jgi:hypothetical protein
MNAKRIIDVFKNLGVSQVKTPLGRWNINNYKQTALKVRYANEDNCGVCNDYNENKTQIKENKIYKEIDELYIYMMGAESLPDAYTGLKNNE